MLHIVRARNPAIREHLKRKVLLMELISKSPKSPGERLLALIQAKHPAYHPIVAIADLAHSDEVKLDPRLELECHKAILPYVESRLATVEQKIDLTETRRVIVSLFEDAEIIEENGVTKHALPMLTSADAELVKQAEEEVAAVAQLY